MRFRSLRLPGAFEIELQPHADERGYFARVYDHEGFAAHNLSTAWVQDNQAHNAKLGIVRGLHFQRPPHAETKLVRVVRGAICDVIVDLRVGSPTFGQFERVDLVEDKLTMLYVPRGFAHGYCTLTDDALVVYKVDATYAPHAEGGVRFDDPELAIPWPTATPLVSDKDRKWPPLKELASPFSWS